MATGVKAYLGDGVYADFDGSGIVLTTENGMQTLNTVYLEPEVLTALYRYVATVKTGQQPRTRKRRSSIRSSSDPKEGK